jgi:hypothetical protein
MIETLIKEIRAAGMLLWVEGDRVRGRMRGGGKIPYDVRLKAEQLRDMGMEAVNAVQQNPDAVYSLVGIPPDEAFALGEAIKRGEALLVGNVIYHRPTGLFDITFMPLERGEQHEREAQGQPRRA